MRLWLKFDYFHIKEAIGEADKIPIGKVAKIIEINRMEKNQVACTNKSKLLSIFQQL